MHICHIAAIDAGSPIPTPTPILILSFLDNPPTPDGGAPVEVAVGTEVSIGDAIGAIDGVGVASSCSQNPFTIDVADAMSAKEVLHPVAATEEAAETAAEK